MAQLALAGGGSAIGGYFGGPIGAQLGWMAGSLIGNAIFGGPEGPDTTREGPRLGDLTVSSSTFGSPIAIAYGTVRVAGNMIWSSGIQEIKNVVESEAAGGGKGGGGGAAEGSTTSITYTYRASFAMAFAEGEADDVLRIWADGKVLYDKTTASDQTKKKDLRFRFYRGDEDQLPDSIIEAAEGEGNVPAHRGLVYLVFDELELADFGNRIPNITAEITFASTFVQPFTTSDVAGWQIDEVAVDLKRNRFYTSSGGPTASILAADLRTMQQVNEGPTDDFIASLSVGFDTGNVYGNTETGNSRPITRWESSTLQETGEFGYSSIGLTNSADRFGTLQSSWEGTVATLLSRRHFLFTVSGFGYLGLLDADTMEYLWHDNDAGDSRGVIVTGPQVAHELETFAWALTCGSSPAATVKLHKITANGAATYIVPPLPSPPYTVGVDLSTFTLAATDVGGTAIKLKSASYDVTDDSLILFFDYDGSGGPTGMDYGIAKWNETDGIVWFTEGNHIGITTEAGMQSSILEQDRVAVAFLDYITIIDIRTGEVIVEEDWSVADVGQGGFQWYDSNSDSIVFSSSISAGNAIIRAYLGRGGGEGENLGSIVADLCSRSGLADADLDVAELTPTVPGFLLGRTTTVRSAIEPLAAAYFFDGVESDYILDFKKRGRANTRTILEEEMAPLDDRTREVISEVRTQEVELPERFTVAYLDRDRNYQPNSAQSKRTLAPVKTMQSRHQMNQTLPIAMIAQEAKEIAEVSLFTAWRERVSYSVHVDWTHIDLDPADVVTYQLTAGAFKARIVQAQIGGGFDIEMDSISEEAANYSSTTVADGGQNFPAGVPAGSSFTQAFLLDLPLLRAVDDTGGIASNLYFAAGGYGQAGWPGATMWKSSEGINYSKVSQLVTEAPWGSVLTPPGAPADPWVTDETNTLVVAMSSGAAHLSSVSQLEMLNGANVAVVLTNDGKPEIIQFRDVTENANGSYSLTGLLRGRRGTEVYIGEHVAGNHFLLLRDNSSNAWMNNSLLGLAELDVARYYRGVGFGSLFEEATTEIRTNIGRDMMPYAVVHITDTPSGGDTDLAWLRRTRFNGEWLDTTDEVPLNEETEEYEIDFRAVGSGTVLRTETGITSPSFTYTAAMKVTDFGTPPAQAEIDIYQISAVVGRGFKATATIDL